MPISRLFICLLPALLPLGLHAQSMPLALPPGDQAIAHELEACLADTEWQPAPALECARQAESRWVAEAERLAARLGQVLGLEARQALEASLIAWGQSRAADLALVEAYHDQLAAAELGDPELLPLSRQLHRNAIFEQRVRYLQRLLDGLDEPRPPEALTP